MTGALTEVGILLLTTVNVAELNRSWFSLPGHPDASANIPVASPLSAQRHGTSAVSAPTLPRAHP
jgi:hypothetical protein